MRGKEKVRLIRKVVAVLLVLVLGCGTNAYAETIEEETAVEGQLIDQSENMEHGDRANSWRYINGERREIEKNIQSDNGINVFSMRPEDARSKGIDVSHHQGTINWSLVKPNIDFAIIRCGYGINTASQDDSQWEANVSACEQLGIPYGVYLYSYALNTDSAQKEAQHALRLLKGHKPTLPVFYDLEDDTISGNCSNSEILEHAKIFCSAMQNAGYEAGVYANKSWWTTYLTSSVYNQWERWVAQYNSTCTYSGNYNYWQYTENGSVSGISGRVDMNYSKLTFSYVDPDVEIEYYPACSFSQSSLTDALKSIGVDSSFSNRKEIAALNGISDYSGTADQNVQLLNLLKQGKLIKAKKTNPTPDGPRGSEMSSGYGRVLPDGDYMIASAANPQYILDIEGGDLPAANGTNVSMFGPLSGEVAAHDIWTIKYNDGFYRISQKNANVSLDVFNGDTLQGTNVQVWENNGTSAQKWAISQNGRNGYRIQAKCSGYSLDISDGNITGGKNIWQYASNDSSAQEWVFIPYRPAQNLENGRYILLSDLDRTMELDVAGDTGDILNGTNVQIWKNTALSRYNSFDITKLDNGYYRLINAASGKALDMYGGVTTLGSNICVYDSNNSTAQQWAITNAGGDSYILWARCSGMVMDVDGAKTENGTNVFQHAYHGEANQRWHFVKAEHSVTYNSMGGQETLGKQTKYYLENLTLSSAVPNREGYIFKGWNDSANLNGTTYAPGSVYAKDADMTLYAVWEKDRVPKISVVRNKDCFTATLSNADCVTEYGFVYGKEPQVTLETPGRRRVVFTQTTSDYTFSFDASGITGDYTVRGYVVYKDKNGKEMTVYSDQVAF